MKNTAKIKKYAPLIIGNWKLNPQTQEKADALYSESKKAFSQKQTISDVAVCAPLVFLYGLQKHTQKSRIALGAQDCFYEEQGTYTGEVSVTMLKNFGVGYVIVGHSERRALGETDDVITKKALAVLQQGLTAVVCVGERVRDAQGDYFNHIESQLKSLLPHIKKVHLPKLVIAYEPIWAISTGDGKGGTATPDIAYEMKLFIQKVISDTLGRTVVSKIRILYGGSVNALNAESLFKVGNTDGFLIGGASLKPQEFGAIIKISDIYGS